VVEGASRDAGESGFRLFGIASASVYKKCGFRDGDLWQKVNEVSLTSPSDALAAYATLSRAPSLTVSLVRAGQAMNIRVDLR
jgi:type II secretory pathway component PulC